MPSVTTVEAEERRQRKILLTLSSVVFVGLIFIVYDYFRIVNAHPLPEKTSQYEAILEKWKAEGFIKTFDLQNSVLVVNEAQWETRTRPEKIGVVTQLARYCAEKKKSQSWVLQVVGQNQGRVIAEMGNAGLKLM
jgi:hypothetical protein